MKIVKLMAENFKRLRVVEITPDGNLVQLTGANGEGKSSVLDSILSALAGTKHMPGTPVRIGETKARVQLDLGEIVVTRKFGKDGSTSLVVESAEGARYPSPQKMLDDLMGSLSFDPLQFATMAPKDQFAELRKLVPLAIDLDQLELANREDFEERTNVNRRLKDAEARREGFVVPLGTPAEPIDDGRLLALMEDSARHNAEIERVSAARVNAAKAIATDRRLILEWRAQAQELMRQADETDARANAASTAFDALPALDAMLDVSEIREQLEEARRLNAQVAIRTQRNVAAVEADILREQSDALSDSIVRRKHERDAALFAAEMPIAGLGFGDGEVLFDTLPLEQASDAQKLRISIAIAMAANPKLRVLRIKQGSLLDSKSVAILREMLDEHDFQCWMEVVDESGTVGIVMEDGNARVAAEVAA